MTLVTPNSLPRVGHLGQFEPPKVSRPVMTLAAHDFRGFGVPLPEVAVPLAGTIEVVGGLLVVLGFLTRPAALAVAMNLLGALLTAGVNEGGAFHLVVGPTLTGLMLFLVWSGAGAISFDTHIADRRSTQSPSNTT